MLFSLLITFAIVLATFAFQLPSDMKIVNKKPIPFQYSEMSPSEVVPERNNKHGFVWMSGYLPGTTDCPSNAEQYQMLMPGGVCVPELMNKAPFSIHWVDASKITPMSVSGTYQEFSDPNCRQATGRVKKWTLPLGCFSESSVMWGPERPQHPFGAVTDVYGKQDCTGPSVQNSMQCNTCSNDNGPDMGPSSLLWCDVSQGQYQFVDFAGVNCTGNGEQQPNAMPLGGEPFCAKGGRYGVSMKMGGALRLQAPGP